MIADEAVRGVEATKPPGPRVASRMRPPVQKMGHLRKDDSAGAAGKAWPSGFHATAAGDGARPGCLLLFANSRDRLCPYGLNQHGPRSGRSPIRQRGAGGPAVSLSSCHSCLSFPPRTPGSCASYTRASFPPPPAPQTASP